MAEYAVATGPGTARIERLLPGPVERVWEYLTDADKRGKWLASGPMELRVGGRVELFFRHRDLAPRVEPTPQRFKHMEDGVKMFGRVTRYEPPQVLSYTWGEADGHESEVTFELTARGQEVLLVITHRNLANREELVSVASGWHTHLDVLVDRLNGREPKPFWSAHAALEAEYEQRLPK